MEPMQQMLANLLEVLGKPIQELAEKVIELRRDVDLLMGKRSDTTGTSRQFSNLFNRLHTVYSGEVVQKIGKSTESSSDDSKAAKQVNELLKEIRSLRSEVNGYRKDFLEVVETNLYQSKSTKTKSFRYFRIQLYVSEGKISKLRRTTRFLVKFLYVFDLVIAQESPPIKGSWWKEFIGKTKNAVTPAALLKIFRLIKRGLEIRLVEGQQSILNKQQAEATKALLDSIVDYDQAALKIGSLLIVKNSIKGEKSIAVRTLSETEEDFLHANSEVLTTPNTLLAKLEELSCNTPNNLETNHTLGDRESNRGSYNNDAS